MNEHCILVIEDQEDLAELYEEALKGAGYKVRNAFTGEEGLAEFKANGADLILLDMTLPEMHGTHVLKGIRALDATVPVIIVTGEKDELHRDETEQLGVQGYVEKPPDYHTLLEMIKHALENPAEDATVVTLRLSKRVIEQLTEIDANLERAITQLLEEQGKSKKATSR